MEAERLAKAARHEKPEDIPIPDDGKEFDPDIHDYHQSTPGRALSPLAEGHDEEAVEREAKRLRVDGPERFSGSMWTRDEPAFEGISFACLASEVKHFLKDQAMAYYMEHSESYMSSGVSLEQFLFGVQRNDFQDRYEALAAQGQQPESGAKKKGRKEIKLSELPKDLQQKFTAEDGADAKEWKAWLSKEAVEVLGLEESRDIRRNKADLIVPTRWVRTNKNDGLIGKDFLAKSRLVVQGFKDKALGQYRRDAPTASAVAESVCLSICAFYQFILIAKDIKNAYFSGKTVEREIYLDPPRGGLPGIIPGQLLKARKAIYGFAEAARLFWLALKEHLEADGWRESKLEPALFYLRSKGRLVGILVTHVDDIEGGLHESVLDQAFQRSSQALEFATNHFRDFIFRGREIKQSDKGHIDVMMKNYALSMKTVKVSHERKQQLEADLTEAEKEQMNSVAGELGWITRQLRCDLAYENGVIQRCKADACVADLLKLRQFVGQAKRGADFKMRFWSDVDVRNGV